MSSISTAPSPSCRRPLQEELGLVSFAWMEDATRPRLVAQVVISTSSEATPRTQRSRPHRHLLRPPQRCGRRAGTADGHKVSAIHHLAASSEPRRNGHHDPAGLVVMKCIRAVHIERLLRHIPDFVAATSRNSARRRRGQDVVVIAHTPSRRRSRRAAEASTTAAAVTAPPWPSRPRRCRRSSDEAGNCSRKGQSCSSPAAGLRW